MLSYLVSFLHAFLPVSLMTGMLVALWKRNNERRRTRSLAISLAVGLLSGILVYWISFRQEAVTSARTSLYAAGILAVVFGAGVLILPGSRYRAVPVIGWGTARSLIAVISAVAAFSFLARLAEQALSSLSILNTELLMNTGGILAGAFLIAFLIPLMARVSTKSGRGVVSGVFLFASILLLLQWCAEVLLGLMRLEMVEVTSGRLSFVAKVAQYATLLPYIQVGIITALSLLFFSGRTVFTPHDLQGMQKAERRKARSRVLFERRWFQSALVSAGVILAVLLSFDLYASRPPKISPPVNLKPDSGGLIKVRIDDVKDGNLHRYSYITDDGHVIRFFMINRSTKSSGGRNRISVVYDACMLCGDMGYIKEKNEVICIACNVRIFTPSIGKAGGCNPIPLNYTIEGEYVVVSAEELDKGARYFSEVISIQVRDPVTGKELNNLTAPNRYEYKGRTYFFESGESEEKFRTSPETYAGDRQSRYFRVQGFRES
ncbi:MAG: Fe-S-containing protein [Alphaproteobacteria bacterium]|uniref:Fe-S-containing protein n=1 Tax=Candidatus Nitrobium versatile TaxID=2884831 RepID=A0A953M034_9BACT|nr:Fe-S-containing protein [Candidatus Nitrobium versatile]